MASAETKRKNRREKGNRKVSSKTRKKHKGIVIATMCVVAALAVFTLPKLLRGQQNTALLDLNDTTVLSYTDIQDSISATGTVESASSTMVYSTASYSVKAVYAEVGDYVEEGELLAELDDQNIQEQIKSQEISMKQSAASGAQQVQTAQDNYDNYKSGLDQGLNSTLNSAQNQVQTAYESYIKAKNTYERYLASLDVGENTTLLNAESALRTAEKIWTPHAKAMTLHRRAVWKRSAHSMTRKAIYLPPEKTFRHCVQHWKRRNPN